MGSLLNIYIYGHTSFINEIHKVLDHGNIRFKIGEGEVIEIISLNQIKELILEDPHQIYLIDQNKIIEDDFISKYLKFLVPKDGITKSFLDHNGIGDISMRSYTDLTLYLEKRLETAMQKPNASDIKSVDEIFEAFDDTKNKN